MMMDQLCKTEGARTPWLTDSENQLPQAGHEFTEHHLKVKSKLQMQCW